MDVKLVRAFADSEVRDAKGYWESTDVMGVSYGKNPPAYASAMSNIIAQLEPDSVFEFGCNAGRNLALLQETAPNIARVSGCDINTASIQHGRSLGLNIHVGDEQALAGYADDEWDILFTISVLDHVPDWKAVMRQLLRMTKQYVIVYEPFKEGLAGRIEERNVNDDGTLVAPYSYFHNYRDLSELGDVRLVGEHNFPANSVNIGPLYTFFVYSKQQAIHDFQALFGSLKVCAA